jgi:hypothetical protein
MITVAEWTMAVAGYAAVAMVCCALSKVFVTILLPVQTPAKAQEKNAALCAASIVVFASRERPVLPELVSK